MGGTISEVRVIATGKRDGRIIALLGEDGLWYSVNTVGELAHNRGMYFFTQVWGHEAQVKVRPRHGMFGARWEFITEADGYRLNNLVKLPDIEL